MHHWYDHSIRGVRFDPAAFNHYFTRKIRRKKKSDTNIIIDEKYSDSSFNKELGKVCNLLLSPKSKKTDGAVKMHNKFFTFSELDLPDGKIKHVVVQTSANISKYQYYEANNIIIMYNNEPLYNEYVTYWKKLKEQFKLECNDIKSCTRILKTPPTSDKFPHGTVKFYPCPRKGDTIGAVLLDFGTLNPPGSKVRIAMAYFTTGRSQIWKNLIWLKNERKIDVKVIVSREKQDENGDGIPNDKLIKKLQNAGIETSSLPNHQDWGRYPGRMHSKYLLLDGRYNLEGEIKNTKLVFTGSHNYTRSALVNNDEIILRIQNRSVYKSYHENWNYLHGMCEGVFKGSVRMDLILKNIWYRGESIGRQWKFLFKVNSDLQNLTQTPEPITRCSFKVHSRMRPTKDEKFLFSTIITQSLFDKLKNNKWNITVDVSGHERDLIHDDHLKPVSFKQGLTQEDVVSGTPISLGQIMTSAEEIRYGKAIMHFHMQLEFTPI